MGQPIDQSGRLNVIHHREASVSEPSLTPAPKGHVRADDLEAFKDFVNEKLGMNVNPALLSRTVERDFQRLAQRRDELSKTVRFNGIGFKLELHILADLPQ